MFEVIEVTLRGVGYAVFSITFLFGIWLLYMINRKLNILDYYRTVKKKPYLYLVSDIILQSIFTGILISIVLVFIGVPLYYNEMLLFIMPISLMLSMYRVRFICITYSLALLSIFALIFNGQQVFGLITPNVELHIPSVLIMVGLIHFIEGLFVFFDGDKRAIPIISKKEDKIIMGHIIHKMWILPLSIIVLQVGATASAGIQMPTWWPIIEYTGYGENVFFSLLPLIGFMSYSTIVYGETPKERSKFSGLLLMSFGIVTILIGRFAVDNILIEIIGVLFMLLLHELIHLMERNRENNKKPIYEQPSKGVRIMQVLEGGYAEHLGMKKGSIIEKVDDVVVENIFHYVKLIGNRKEKSRVTIINMLGETKEYEIHDGKHLEHMGIRVVPDKPLFLYPYDKFSYIGLFDFIKKID